MTSRCCVRSFLAVALALVVVLTSGCGFGTRRIFTTSRQLVATPADRGLAYEDLYFPARDGVMLHGWYLPGRPGERLVLFCEGNAANISYRVDNLAALHALGFSLFIFDYRGFGASSGRILREEDLLADALGALDLLGARGWTPDEMIYYGQSLGAAVALNLALEKPPAGVVMECAFTNMREIAWHMSPWTYAMFGWWSIDARFDNLEGVSRMNRPLLMLHGAEDRIAPLSMAERIFGRARQPKTLVVFPGAGHSDCSKIDPPLYGKSWQAFVTSLPPAAGERDVR